MIDEKALEAAARAIHKARQHMGFGGEASWEYEPANIHALHMETARAAITAYEAARGDGKDKE